jgi:hypothetical protein
MKLPYQGAVARFVERVKLQGDKCELVLMRS